ncbi:MAG: carboxypeptidase-like regulatory domain-containing protein [Planctomycetota bacterium]
MALPTNDRPGGAARLLLALIAAAGLLVVLLLAGRDRDPVPASLDTSGAGRPAPGETAGLAPLEDGPGARRSAAGGRIVTAGGLVIPVGVRLAGAGELAGRVVERGSRAGVANARVDLLSLPPAGRDLVGRILRLAKFGPEASSRAEPVAVAASGPGGDFLFAGVRPGTYFLEARSAWHVPDRICLAAVTVAGAEPVEAVVRAGGRILGRVRHPDGRPAGGIDVLASPGPGTLLTRLRDGDLGIFPAITAADGTFAVPGVPPGRGWELAAVARGAALSHATGIEVVAGADTRIELVLRRGGTVEGRVLSGGPEEAAAAEPRPLVGAHLGVVPHGLRDLRFVEEILAATHATSDTEGRYRIEGAPPGELDVVAFAPGHRPGRSATVRVADAGVARAADLVLPRGPLLEVHVRRSDGSPLAGVRASWFVADFAAMEFDLSLTPFLLQGVEGFEYPVSDRDGRLVAGPFPGRPPHHVLFAKAGYAMRTHAWDPEGDGGRIEVVMLAGGAVEGIVMDAGAARPVPSFTITAPDRLESDPGAPGATNPFSGGLLVEDAAGRFRVEALAPGRVELTFTAAGHLPATVGPLEVVEGGVTRGIIVELAAGGTIRGRVVDPAGEGVEGAAVVARDEDGRPLAGWNRGLRLGASSPQAEIAQGIASEMLEMAASLGSVAPGAVTSGADGAFEIGGLRPGAVVLTASHRDFAPGRAEGLAVAAGDPLEGVTISLPRGGGIHGFVEDRHGEPVASAIVVALRPEGLEPPLRGELPAYEGESDAEGAYRIAHLPGGSYLVLVTRGDEGLNPMSFLGTLNFDVVTVPEGESVRTDLVDSSAASCRVFGTVTAGGAPVARGSLFAMGFQGENVLGVDVRIAEIEPDGTYAFAGLAPGPHQIRYQGRGADGAGGSAEVRIEVEVPDLPSWRLDIPLPEGAIEGRVVGARDGEPVRGAEVVLRRTDLPPVAGTGIAGALLAAEERHQRARTGENGEFALRRLQEGTYELSVGAPRWGEDAGRYAAAAPRIVTLWEGAVERGLEIELAPALALSGRVLGAGEGPLPGALVRAWPRGGDPLGAPRATADAGGSFTLSSLAPGLWDVGAAAEGWADSALVAVELPAGAEVGLEIVLERGVPVTVLVHGPDGRPLPGATARLVRTDGRGLPVGSSAERALEGLFAGRGVSGADGRLELGPHASGTWRLDVARGGRLATREGIVLAPGGPVELEVILE